MTSKPPNLRDSIFLPREISEATLAYYRSLRQFTVEFGTAGIPFFLPEVDAKVNPGLPGELYYWLGRSGHFKTAGLYHVASSLANLLIARNLHDKYFPLFVSTENIIESLTVRESAKTLRFDTNDFRRGKMTDQNLHSLERWLELDRKGNPLVLMGSSYSHGAIPISVELIAQGIHLIEHETGRKCILMAGDFIQNFGASSSITERQMDNTVAIIRDNSKLCQRLCKDTKSFWLVGAQARAEVDDYPNPFPTQRDSAWGIQIEQDANAMVYSVRPWKYKKQNKTQFFTTIQNEFGVSLDDPRLLNLVIMGALKQKEGDVGDRIPVFADPAMGILDSWDKELRSYGRETAF